MHLSVIAITLHSILALIPPAATPAADANAVATLQTDQQTRRVKLTVASEGNEVRYRVREQLAGFSLPNDAIGKTSRLSGAIVFESTGRIVREESKFVVQLDSLASDQSRRDNFVRRNTLQTTQFPTAEFVPASATGLPASLPVAGEMVFKLFGDFTVHGVTKPTTWDVKGTMLANGAFTGTATTSFKFADFSMAIPRVPTVMSVVDNITLEMDIKLVPSSQQ